MSAPNATAPSPTLTSRRPITSALRLQPGHPDPGPATAQQTVHPPAALDLSGESQQLCCGRPGQVAIEPRPTGRRNSSRPPTTGSSSAMTAAWACTTDRYAVGLLKASIGNLTGDANSDGLPDSVASRSITSAQLLPRTRLAGPNAINNSERRAQLDDVCPGA
jgi:hypothetical protein